MSYEPDQDSIQIQNSQHSMSCSWHQCQEDECCGVWRHVPPLFMKTGVNWIRVFSEDEAEWSKLRTGIILTSAREKRIASNQRYFAKLFHCLPTENYFNSISRKLFGFLPSKLFHSLPSKLFPINSWLTECCLWCQNCQALISSSVDFPSLKIK